MLLTSKSCIKHDHSITHPDGEGNISTLCLLIIFLENKGFCNVTSIDSEKCNNL
jgi:hypothetical protein